MFKIIRGVIFNVLNQFQKSDEQISINDVLIDKTKEQIHGDIYTNAAMMFAKRLKVSPLVLAQSIRDSLATKDYIKDVVIAGPGFINIKLTENACQTVINEILEKKEAYSFTNLKNNASINVEFVSANPTGPLHTGHARNAVFGSVAVNLLEKIGYVVTKEFYINDQGNQVKSLARSLYLRYREALGAKISEDCFKEDMYCGSYVKDLAREFADIYQDTFLNKDESEWIEFFGDFAVKKMMENVKKDLALIGIVMDKYTSEADLCKKNMVEEALAILSERGDVYEGIIPEPKGMISEDWEERPQTLFRSTKYGDDIDRPIRKSDGSWTYFAGDMAYHLDKIKRGYKKMLAILGADHCGYVKRLQSAVKALSNDEAEVDIRLYQLVNFLENGALIKMSKRSGNFITLKDVVERVGKDITRYMMISRHHEVMIDFDFVKAVEFSMENPIFYIQYAYARICSIFKNYETTFGTLDKEELMQCDKGGLNDEAEILLMKSLSFWPEYVSAAAIAVEPHRIPNYLQDLAYCVHSLWNKGKANSKLRFIDTTNKDVTLSRLSLLESTKLVLEDGFRIMGITPLSEMQ